MSYTIMESPVGPGKKSAEFLPYGGFHGSWMSGAKLEELPPNPIELTWNPDNEDGIRKAYYESGVVLMLKDLIAALREAGVDNLETYPVVVRSTRTDEICKDYEAVNIIGAVAVADIENSVVIDEGGGMIDMIFGGLAIDMEKAKGHSFFRLAESVGAILVHEKVSDHVREKGGFGLTFTEPEEFCG